MSCLPLRTLTATLSMLFVIVGRLYDLLSNVFVQIFVCFFFIAHLRVVTHLRYYFESPFVTVSPAASAQVQVDLVHAYCTLNVLIADCFFLYPVILFYFPFSFMICLPSNVHILLLYKDKGKLMSCVYYTYSIQYSPQSY